MPEAEYTIEDIVQFLEDIKAQPEPFWGDTTISWQAGKMVMWKPWPVIKPKSGTKNQKEVKAPESNN